MSAIASIQNNTIYFEQFVRDQLKTQESEMRAELKDRESEMREVKAQKARDSKIVEELRPLCEEVPNDARDPVSMKPFKTPLLYRCGHSLGISTILDIARRNSLHQDSLIECPMCRRKSPLKSGVSPVNLMGCVEVFKKIEKIFRENNQNEQSKPSTLTFGRRPKSS